MNDVDRGPGELGESGEMVYPLGLDQRRTALVVLGGVGLAGGEEFLLALEHEGFVFAVGGDDDAEFLGQFERGVELGVVDAEGPLVGQKYFKRRERL